MISVFLQVSITISYDLLYFAQEQATFGANNEATETSLFSVSTSHKIEVFPNPVVDNIHLNIENGEYTITTVTGNTVQSGSFEQDINVSNIEKGFYILTILKNDENYVAKFLK